MNYNSTQPGTIYGRVKRIVIDYNDQGAPPVVTIERATAVSLADGTARALDTRAPIAFQVDLANAQNELFPLVHPTTSEPLGSDVSMQNVFLGVLAVVRAKERAQDAADDAAAAAAAQPQE